MQFKEEKVKQKLSTLLRKEEEDTVKILADRYGIPYIDLSATPIEVNALEVVPEEKAKFGKLIPFQIVRRHLRIGVRSPNKEETKAVLNSLSKDGYTYDLFLISESSFNYGLSYYSKVPKEEEFVTGLIQVSDERLKKFYREIKSIKDVQGKIKAMFNARTTDILEVIMAGALVTDASDVHIEPQENGVRLRFRLDGVLQDIIDIPHQLYKFLLSRIKLISELKLNIHDQAQDGRFTIKTHDFDIEVRTSTLPGPYGENIVLRILNPKSIQIGFDQLGMQPWVAEVMKKELRKPNGMILTTGPTGSGKTTTLYTFLRTIHRPEIKIITIEDPIEYHLVGIEQTQVAPEKGYTFANGLRAIVRQDPDVILVGEIRDLDTAKIALQAAHTGHLVFSTLHTNNAAGAVPRLLTLGAKSAVIAPAINVVMAQRLLRKLCPNCREKIIIDEKLKKDIERQLANFPKGVPTPPISEWKIYQSKKDPDCEVCNGVGYKGRVGVFEIILFDHSIETLVLREPSEFEIEKAARAQGQINLHEDGLLKVLAGITDFNELARVVG